MKSEIKQTIEVINYNKFDFEEKSIKNIEECFKFKNDPSITWLNINGLHNTSIIEQIRAYYNIHSLVVEDVLDTKQRPKIQIFDNYILVVLKILIYNKKLKKIEYEQMSVIIGDNFVISFQEENKKLFEIVKDKIKNSIGKIRDLNSDYLAYSLLDIVIDNYFIVLEEIGEDIENSEEELMSNPESNTLKEIYFLKREILSLRKSIWPLREVISKLERSDSSLIKKQTELYLRDLYEHTIQIIDTVETYRDMVAGLLDLYLSSISNKTNEVMKVLTIISTIFIPLTFIAGIYGMNFKFMPELFWKWSYPVLWAIMIIIGIIMFIFFRKKKWI